MSKPKKKLWWEQVRLAQQRIEMEAIHIGSKAEACHEIGLEHLGASLWSARETILRSLDDLKNVLNALSPEPRKRNKSKA